MTVPETNRDGYGCSFVKWFWLLLVTQRNGDELRAARCQGHPAWSWFAGPAPGGPDFRGTGWEKVSFGSLGAPVVSRGLPVAA